MNEIPGISFRAAQAKDKQRMLEITAHTWDDGDYIHEVWDEWLADPHGEFTVAELDGVVVALAKLTMLGPGEFWMEGLRVDPNARQHGVGHAMHEYQLALAQRLGGQTVRYATGHDNTASHKIAARHGFRQIAAYLELQAGADPSLAVGALAPGDAARTQVRTANPNCSVLTADDWPALQDALRRAVFIPLVNGLYKQSWKWYALTGERLRKHLAAGQVMAVRQGPSLAAWAIVVLLDGFTHVQVSCIEGEADALEELAGALRGYAASLGKQGVEISACEDARLLGALEKASYRSPEQFSVHVFEKRL